jgi:hypothetical protein
MKTKVSKVSTLVGVIVAIVLSVTFYFVYKNQEVKQNAVVEAQKYVFTKLITDKDSVMKDWVLTFNQIETDLQTIKEKEKLITIKSSDVEITKGKREQILSDIKDINSLLDQNKKKIAVLNEKLKKSGLEITGFKTRITDLESLMKEREADILALKTVINEKDVKINQLNTNVADMKVTITLKNDTIVNQTNKLNTGHITSGTYKDLNVKGLMSKEGGFLGVGKKKCLIENFPDSTFTTIDITKLKTITINAKSAKLVTDHPVGSYKVVYEGKNKVTGIEIIDPSQFWKISKYAVVEITK